MCSYSGSYSDKLSKDRITRDGKSTAIGKTESEGWGSGWWVRKIFLEVSCQLGLKERESHVKRAEEPPGRCRGIKVQRHEIDHSNIPVT